MSRQSRGISSDLAVLILPEKLNRCKSHFWRRRSFARNRARPSAGLDPERRTMLADQFQAAAAAARNTAAVDEIARLTWRAQAEGHTSTRRPRPSAKPCRAVGRPSPPEGRNGPCHHQSASAPAVGPPRARRTDRRASSDAVARPHPAPCRLPSPPASPPASSPRSTSSPANAKRAGSAHCRSTP